MAAVLAAVLAATAPGADAAGVKALAATEPFAGFVEPPAAHSDDGQGYKIVHAFSFRGVMVAKWPIVAVGWRRAICVDSGTRRGDTCSSSAIWFHRLIHLLSHLTRRARRRRQ